MKEHGEIAGDGLHSSKRLRLSILRSENRGRFRNLSDSAGPSHSASTSSAAVDLPSVPNCSVQMGVTANVRGSSIEAEPTSLHDYSCRHALQNTSLVGTVDESSPGNEENFSGVSDTHEQSSEADYGVLDIPCEVPDDFANQHGELHGRQPERAPSHSMEPNPAEPGVEISPAISVDPVVPRHAQEDPEDETDDAWQGGDVSGDDPRIHLEQEVEAGAFQEMESDVRPLGLQQQDEALSHNVATFGESETLALGHTDVLETSLEIVDSHERERAIVLAEARNQAIETIELSEDDVDAESTDPTLTAFALAEPRLTAEDFDAFAPDPHHFSQPVPKEAGTSDPERLGTQMDSEGTTCSICMEPWTNAGNHRICSLACGHLFGKACIKRWLQLAGRKHGKCPHCNKRARAEDLRTLYVSRIAVIDGETQLYMEEAGLLRTENEQLKKQVADLRDEVRRTQTLFRALAGDQRHASMLRSSTPRPRDQRGHYTSENRRHHITHRASLSAPHGSILDDHFSLQSGRSTWERPQDEHHLFERDTEEWTYRPDPPQYWRPGLGGTDFVLQDEKSLNGAKVFDMDGRSNMLLVSGRPPDCETSSGLTKIDLRTLCEGECINLPPGTNAIRDIRIAPFGSRTPGRLALVASLGKKLSLFSLERNIVMTTYTLPVGRHLNSTFNLNPSWACAWDPCDPNRVYTGLQNGTLLTFDLRRNSSSPLDTLKGPNSTPVHTLQYVPEIGRALSQHDGTRESRGGGLLSASSNTLLFWPGIDQPQEKRPVCISQPQSSSVCVSVSYNAAADVMVASFRPKPSLVPLNDGASSSAPWTDSQAELPSPSTPRVLPESAPTAAASISVPVPTHFSYVRTSSPAAATAENSTLAGTHHPTTSWEPHGRMVGHTSQAVLSRTAIVKEYTEWRPSPLQAGDARRGCRFASADEGSKSVWLWDLTSPRPKQMLTSHPSPVLDIRTAVVGGLDLLGCISERTLQLYKRSSYR